MIILHHEGFMERDKKMGLITENPVSAQALKDLNLFPDCGATVTFEGVVRNHHEGKSVEKLRYESYWPMAEKTMRTLICDTQNEWPETRILAMHRVGELKVGEVAVAIVVWAPHRGEAFRACEAMINRIKKRVPVWKKEFYGDGSAAWVRCHHG